MITEKLNRFGTVRLKPPNLCPICKHHIAPKYQLAQEGTSLCDDDHSGITAVFSCPACNELFLAVYGPTARESYYEVYGLSPKYPDRRCFDKAIEDISPAFVTIYNQALAAETYKLDEIVGCGYRRALEFLVKDYLINNERDEAQKSEILRRPLAQCISCLDNERIKAVASRAVWIGNDETHYIRKHENEDTETLKSLIDLTVLWIDMEAKTKEALERIQPKK